jgi:hypothetical protein
MLDPPTCAKKQRNAGCPCDAAASVVVAAANEPDMPTVPLHQDWAAIQSSVS